MAELTFFDMSERALASISGPMAEFSFFDTEGRVVAKGRSSDGRWSAFVFADRAWVPWGGAVLSEGSILSQTDLADEFREAYSAIDELYRLAKPPPEVAFG